MHVVHSMRIKIYNEIHNKDRHSVLNAVVGLQYVTVNSFDVL